jgi:pentafunctional AROM polypeptide
MDGSKRMKERPMEDLLAALQGQSNVKLEFLEKENYIPFKITSDGFEGGEICLKSKVSSQYISSLLMSAPYAKKPVKIVLADIKDNDKIVSEPYIWMTISIMEKFGIKVTRTSSNTFEVSQGVYKNPVISQL